MSILSKIKSAAQSVAKTVYKTLNPIISRGNANVAGLYASTNLAKSQQPAQSKGQSAVNQAYASQGTKQQTPVPIGVQFANAQSQVRAGTSGSIMSSQDAKGISEARAIAAGAKGSQTPINSYGGFTPTTLSAGNRTMTAPKNMLSSAGDTQSFASFTPSVSPSSFSSVNSSVLSGGSSVSLPSTPSYLNPGAINNAGLVNVLADKQYNPETGLFTDIPQDPAVADDVRRQNEMKALLDIIPKKDDVNADPEVQRQQAEVQARKQELNNYTAQLNSIVAKQNQDLLQTRGILSAEGGTETVYGGIAAQINREAAIKALPIQAQISAAQGNLELAQDYLADLKKIKQDAIDADFTYNMKKFEAIAGFVTGEQKIRLENLRKTEERAYEATTKNLEYQKSVTDDVLRLKPSLISKVNAINPASPTFMKEIGDVLAQLPTKSTTDTTNKFTPTQTSKGAYNAGLPIETFNELDQDVKNYYVNLSPTQAQSLKETLLDVQNGEMDVAEVKEYIENNGASPAVKNYLNQLVDSVAPAPKQGFWSGLWKKITGSTE